MKKENKKLAQQKRAEQRKKAETKNKIINITKIGLPILAVVLLVVLIIVDPLSSSNTNTGTDSSSSDGLSVEGNADDTSTETETPTLQTDTSLTVTDGDTVNIDYVGTIDGVEFSGGNTQGAGADLVIGSGSYIDDFEEQLIGAHPGDTVEVNVTFPEDYGNESLNGKDAVFEVVINGIYQ